MRWTAIFLLVMLVGCGAPRTVTIDITNELMCKNQFLTNVSDECSTPDGCDEICYTTACESYGMVFVGSVFKEETCNCICQAENKMKTVANYYDNADREN